MVCSRCKISKYCSKDCQKEDWKEHKEHCNRYLKSEHWANERNHTGLKKLLDEWHYQSSSVLKVTVRSALTNAQIQAQPPEAACILQLGFDYNLLTFRPVKPPDVERASDPPDCQPFLG